MQDFYLPYQQIKYFTLKEDSLLEMNGIYRHNLAFRVYLYLAHYHGGRISLKHRKELVAKFGTSHTALHKAIDFLKEIGFVYIASGWIHCRKQEFCSTLTKKQIGRNFNVKFKFNYDILFDRKKFTNHLYLTLFQASAMVRGKKTKKLASRPTQPEHGSTILKGGDEKSWNDDKSHSHPHYTDFTQLQASVYLAKMTKRHPMTMFNRNKQIDAENHYLKNPEPLRDKEPQTRTALTEDGFNTKVHSTIVGFREKEAAEDHLRTLKKDEPAMFNPCFVMEANHGGFVIAKKIPNKYIFRVETKRSFKKFDYDFQRFEDNDQPSLD